MSLVWDLSTTPARLLRSPGGIRTRVSTLRGWRAKPLHYKALVSAFLRAAGGVRTRDLYLGKVALYQLSYNHIRKERTGRPAR